MLEGLPSGNCHLWQILHFLRCLPSPVSPLVPQHFLGLGHVRCPWGSWKGVQLLPLNDAQAETGEVEGLACFHHKQKWQIWDLNLDLLLNVQSSLQQSASNNLVSLSKPNFSSYGDDLKNSPNIREVKYFPRKKSALLYRDINIFYYFHFDFLVKEKANLAT